MASSSESSAPPAAKKIKCAPSNNLNVGFPHFDTAADVYAKLLELTAAGGKGEFVVRNFVAVIKDFSIKASTVESDLFPLGALEYYTKKNM